MDTTVLTEKLESLRRCVQRIEEKQPCHIDVLKQSIDLQEASIILPTTSQQLKKAVGFRNIAIHQYEVINREIVYVVSQHAPQNFHQFAQEISHYAKL